MAKKKAKSADDLIAEFEKAADALEQARATMQEIGAEAFDAYTMALFEQYPALDGFMIVGWTPGFNDGDPCTHSMEVMVTGDDFCDWGHEDEAYDILENAGKLEDEDEQEEADEDDIDAEFDEDAEPDGDDDHYERRERQIRQFNGKLPKKVTDSIRSRLRSFDDVLESIHDTNWKLTFTRGEDGKGHCEKEEYECGY